MTEDVETIVLDILKRIQGDIANMRGDLTDLRGVVSEMRAEITERFGSVESRLATVEDSLKRQRRDIAGLLVIAKSAAGDLALQIEAVERRTAALEAAGQ